MTVWPDHHYAVIDVEGNGQQPPDLVELGIIPITDSVIGEPTTWLCRPTAPITTMARRIHGITNEMVSAAPDFAVIAAEVRARLDGAVLVAHNAGVDMAVLSRKLPGFAPACVLDTLKLSRRLLPDQASYRLGSLVSTLQLDHGLFVSVDGPSGVHTYAAADGGPDSRMSSRPGGSGGSGETGWPAAGATGCCPGCRMSSRPGGSGGIGEVDCWLDGMTFLLQRSWNLRAAPAKTAQHPPFPKIYRATICFYHTR